MHITKNLKRPAWEIIRAIIGFLVLLLSIVAIYSLCEGISNKVCFNINSTRASEFGSFFGGYVGVMFSILSTLLLIYTSMRIQG